MGGHKYFIMFIDEYSHGSIELIHEKSDSLEAFKAFKAKVDIQLGRRSTWFILIYRGGEYNGRYDELGRNLRPLVKYL